MTEENIETEIASDEKKLRASYQLLAKTLKKEGAIDQLTEQQLLRRKQLLSWPKF